MTHEQIMAMFKPNQRWRAGVLWIDRICRVARVTNDTVYCEDPLTIIRIPRGNGDGMIRARAGYVELGYDGIFHEAKVDLTLILLDQQQHLF